jgi:hypothetical protein
MKFLITGITGFKEEYDIVTTLDDLIHYWSNKLQKLKTVRTKTTVRNNPSSV